MTCEVMAGADVACMMAVGAMPVGVSIAKESSMTRAPFLYLANAAVLSTHQVEGAYWHEWNLFRLPGGLTLYLALNIPIFVLVLCGQHAHARGLPSARWASIALAGAGLFAVCFHSAWLCAGDAAFTRPISVGLLGATMLLSAAQLLSLPTKKGPEATDVPAPPKPRA
jgi:hypothetical protein